MSGIDSDLIRGHIDTIILKSLYHGDKYGLEIIQEVEEKSGGTYELKQPTLYSCLKRLESQGLISSYWEDSDIGGKRHYYKLTDLGKETYQKNQEEWLRSRAIIDNLIYNTSVNYAPIYDNDADAPKDEIETKEEPSVEQTPEETATEEVEKPLQEENQDYLQEDNQEDESEFASFDNLSSTEETSFFESNSEQSSDAEFEEEEETSPAEVEQPTEEHDDVINLNLDNIEEEPSVEQTSEETHDNYYSATNVFADDEKDTTNQTEDDISQDDQIYVANDSQQENDDDQIYELKPDYVDAEEPEVIHDEQPAENKELEDAPTYINFGSENYDEADITNINEPEYVDNQAEQHEETKENEQDNGPSIGETANAINEQYYSAPIQHASEEEINKLYKHTENYENLQAGYTDEAYKQALNELEAYGGGGVAATYTKKDKSEILSFEQLKEDLEKDGITISKHERQLKESDENKLYVKANEINLIKNWIVWGSVSLVMLVIFGIMSAFKSTYTYNFAFWEFAVAMAAALVIPGYSTIRYLINPYRKTTAKFAPRLSILINLLISVQLVVITYCVNLQIGFYSFAQDNYNHLLWILPLVLSFIPVLQSLVYMFLFNSKKFHV